MSETDERYGDWMMTFTGRRFWALDPRPEDVDIEDIAHALSMICRFQGHSRILYSVAEHSWLMALAAQERGLSPAEQLQALMHDAAEAYVCDLVRPVKRSVVGYDEAEVRVERAIQRAFNLEWFGNPPQIKHLDNLILYDEAKALMRVDREPWHELYAPGLGVEIVGFAPAEAKARFLDAFRLLSGSVTQPREHST